jgi:ligand-binding sensor domain-containing protein/serine/threonine protein kinase
LRATEVSVGGHILPFLAMLEANSVYNRGIKMALYCQRNIVMLKIAQAGIAILFLLLLSSGIKAQQGDIKFEHLSIDQGLSQNSVSCMLQDRYGYMWFGTQDGLNRYDGYGFISLKQSLQEKNSLSDNYISSLVEDSAGNLWIGTNGGGLNRYNLDKQSFTVYRNDPRTPGSISDNYINSLYIDNTGKLWVGTSYGGLNRFDEKSQTFTIFRNVAGDPNSISGNSIKAIFRDSRGRLWIGTTAGLNRYDENRSIFTVYRNDPKNLQSVCSDFITTILEDNSGTIWVGTSKGLNRYNDKNDSFYTYYFNPELPNGNADNYIKVVHKDSQGIFWIGTNNGLNRFDPETKTFTVYRKNPDLLTSLSNNNILSIYSDRSGVLWIGSLDGGIDRLDPLRERFFTYRRDLHNTHFISDNSITALYEDSTGALWVGTATGLNRYDAKSGQNTSYQNNDLITAIYEDRTGTLWIGKAEGLNSYEIKKGSSNNYVASLLSAAKNIHISSILEDKEGLLWFGTTNSGLLKFDPKSGSAIIYKKDPDSKTSISSSRISVVYEDSQGRLWIGTIGNGLNLYDRKSDSFSVYGNGLNPPTGISSNRITSICEDREGILWIGTTNGLHRFDPNNRSFTILTEKEGLANDNIYGILEDREGNLWISTNRGLSEYFPKEKRFLNFDVTDGLQSNEFNYGAFFKNSRGEMFFGGINGFNRFYPEQIKKNSFVPQIAVTLLNVSDSMGKQFLAYKPNSSDLQLSLPYNQNFFSFGFTALNYTHSEKNLYAYKMEGVDKDWIYCDSRRYASYPNLGPGEYLFRVKGSNNDRVWNEEGAAIKIFISPPLWKTWWAYLLYTVTIAGIGYGRHRFRLETLERRNRLLEAKIQERTAALAEQKEELARKNEDLIRSKEELVESHKQTELVFSALSDLLPDTVLDNRYRLESKIGSGGFGAVYRATHLELNRPVAVKVFRPSAINATSENLERFRLEGISACRVNHPNAISVHDSGVTGNGIAYIVMELLEGITLKQELKEKGRMPLDRIAEIVIPVCEVLYKAHSLGIIHRDIKPDNIFLHRSEVGEEVKLVDFGIAKLIGEEWGTNAQSLTGTGAFIGTPDYMAPERLGEGGCDGKADVYSLGVVLYEMLCGRVPFHSAVGSWQTALMHMTMEPLPPRQIDPSIPEAVEAAVLHALIKEPEKRPDAAQLKKEFLTALGAGEHYSSEKQKRSWSRTVEFEQSTSTTKKETDNRPEQWQRIDSLIDEALEMDPNQWDVFLGPACAGDEEMVRQVKRLLVSYQQEDDFLDSSALEEVIKKKKVD